MDTYDDLLVQPYGTALARTAGGFGYTVSAQDSLYGAGGGGDGWISTNAGYDTLTFHNFTFPVYALGGEFFGSDIYGQFTPGTSIVLTASDGVSTTYLLGNSETDSFVGFISSSPLNSVMVATAGEGYWVTANNLTLALPVPEPGAYGMMLAGLGMVGWLARRRKA